LEQTAKRRQLYEQGIQDSRSYDEEYKEGYSAGVHTFEAPECIFH
jgi:hypothetical protein